MTAHWQAHNHTCLCTCSMQDLFGGRDSIAAAICMPSSAMPGMQPRHTDTASQSLQASSADHKITQCWGYACAGRRLHATGHASSSSSARVSSSPSGSPFESTSMRERKRTVRRGAIFTAAPVRGLRPMRAADSATEKTPNPDITTFSPPRNLSTDILNNDYTILLTSFFGRAKSFATASIN